MTITTLTRSLGLAAALAAAAGCAPDVPDTPGYEADVKPLLDAHCVRCHGAPAIGGAPSEFRLDIYDTVDGIAGARDSATTLNLIAPVLAAGEMPPTHPLDDWELETFERWIETGAQP